MKTPPCAAPKPTAQKANAGRFKDNLEGERKKNRRKTSGLSQSFVVGSCFSGGEGGGGGDDPRAKSQGRVVCGSVSLFLAAVRLTGAIAQPAASDRFQIGTTYCLIYHVSHENDIIHTYMGEK